MRLPDTQQLQALSKQERAVYVSSRNTLRFRDFMQRDNLFEQVNFGTEVAPKWRTLKGEDLARYKVSQTLDLVYEMVGLKPKQFPSPRLQKELCKFIVTKYPELTSENIYDAFTMAIADELPETVDLEHFGVMSLPYVQTVLKVYRRWQAQVLVEAERKLQLAGQVTDVVEEIRTTSRRNDEAVKNFILTCYINLKTENCHDYLRADHYDFLDDCGLIDLTVEEKQELYERAKRNQSQQVQASRTAHLREHFHKVLRPTRSVKDEAKELAILAQMEKWLQNLLSYEALEEAMQRVCHIDTACYKINYQKLQQQR